MAYERSCGDKMADHWKKMWLCFDEEEGR